MIVCYFCLPSIDDLLLFTWVIFTLTVQLIQLHVQPSNNVGYSCVPLYSYDSGPSCSKPD